MWGVSSVRSISDDVYSAIRAVLYTSLLDNNPILSRCGNLNECCQVNNKVNGFVFHCADNLN